MLHGRFRDALEHVARQSDASQDLGKRIMLRVRALQLDLQIHAVDLLPHFRRDRLANGSGVFTRESKAGENGVRILIVERKKPMTFSSVASPHFSLKTSVSPDVSMRGRHWCAGASGKSS
jgi:hypothetical protein